MNVFELALVAVTFALATGFRVLVPLLLAGILSALDVIEVRSGFEWLSTPGVLTALGLAVGIELLAYSVPFLDNLLDTIAVPAALIVGSLSAFIILPDAVALPIAWALSLMGGGSAAVIAGSLAKVRLLSTASTGGLGNVPLGILEAGAAISVPLLSVLFLFAGVSLAVSLLIALLYVARKAATKTG